MILKPKYQGLSYIFPIWLIFVTCICVSYVISRSMVEPTGELSIFVVVWFGIDTFVIAIPTIILHMWGAGFFTTLYYSYPYIRRNFKSWIEWGNYMEKVIGRMVAISFMPPIVQLVVAFI